MRPLYAAVFIYCFWTSALHGDAQSLLPRVDKRIELLGIACQLAGADDLTSGNAVYSKAIQNHFMSHKSHPFIEYVRHLGDSMAKAGATIRLWEIPSVALHLSQPLQLEPLLSIGDTANADGWDDRTLLTKKFVTLLKQFYRDADCHSFFKSQESYYQAVQRRSDQQMVRIDEQWVPRFISISPAEKYYPILSLLDLGDGNYIRVNFSKDMRNTHTIFVCKKTDALGLPVDFQEEWKTRIILHEHIHTFVNQLVERNRDTLWKPAEMLLARPEVWSKVKDTFFSNERYLLYESMVRACSILYLTNVSGIATSVGKEVAAQEKAGFFWMKDLVKLLQIYQAKRVVYEDLAAFMPEISSFFKQI